ncbi:hypothetical protein GCM10009716_10610 [Streptomyces sodiiphilus]|uniref:Uncharacterized protein n=1 Tax=Streptomyces sodiiphilus TaxID=226217 RepID=A0ABP5A465_9ACTN
MSFNSAQTGFRPVLRRLALATALCAAVAVPAGAYAAEKASGPAGGQVLDNDWPAKGDARAEGGNDWPAKGGTYAGGDNDWPAPPASAGA